ncbi:uncharacterized protein LOC129775997 [Toxorhynchites rutilus septentrionalis]|uniref:uncharacterized protein LOC129775997 n=1 Tax=Toxorhynchites rutilus septentrionalis TaxID=329112 RepID=UPI002478C512|nr:uncharacterized protein LOC129775997 [Toxorhynchites rutilus septentrionalis]
MSRIYLLVTTCFTLMLLPSTLGAPFFWFPLWYPTASSGTSSSSGAVSSSTSSTNTPRSPVNASISLGNRLNTSAVEDLGTVIDGLTIARSKRFVPLLPPSWPGFSLFQNISGIFNRQKRSSEAIPSTVNESVIKIGHQIIKLPPGGISNLTIHIIDGGSYPPLQNVPIQTGTNDTWIPFIERIKDVFDNLFV